MEVIGIGLANIDLVAYVKDSFLTQHKIPKGLAKKLGDLDFGRLRGDLDFGAIPGGCIANTLCGLATEGVKTQFFGKIGDDSFRDTFRSSFNEYTVVFNVEAGKQESSQCAVLVTPDGERSFAYTSGASWDLTPSDLDEEAFARANLIYAEIYLFEFGQDRNTARFVFESAQRNSVPLAMKVMDAEFGKKYAQNIKTLSDSGTLKLLIGNHENLPSAAGADNYQDAIEIFKGWKCDVLLTLNKDGAYFISNGIATHYPITPVENPKNTTGAGDQFVAGFLSRWLNRKPIFECMEHAAYCARVILQHDTARPPLVNSHIIRF